MKPLLMLAIFLAAPSARAEPTRVELKAAATVDGEQVLLRDVATLAADTPMAATALAPAPLPGSRAWLSRDQIELRLERAGYAPRDVTLDGAATVTITRASQTVLPDAVAAALARLLGTPVVIERLAPPGPLPVGQIDWRLRGEVPQPLPERCSLTLEVLVGGKPARSVLVAIALPPAPAVPVAPPIPAAAPIATPVALANPPAPVPVKPAPPAWQVRRGDRLQVTARAGRVSIVLAAEARGQGTLGDVVQAETTIGTSKRTVAVRLTAPDKAVLEW
jgi:hypothetical protein